LRGAIARRAGGYVFLHEDAVLRRLDGMTQPLV
jgi:hypothetical protein